VLLVETLNFPGNFTASKLKWVKDNEPEVFAKIHKYMLPGDFLAMRLTGQIVTSISGASEAVLWDFKNNCISDTVLRHYEIPREMVPEVLEAFSE
jgi:xylulokinase